MSCRQSLDEMSVRTGMYARELICSNYSFHESKPSKMSLPGKAGRFLPLCGSDLIDSRMRKCGSLIDRMRDKLCGEARS